MTKRYKIIGRRLVTRLLHARVRRDTRKAVLANIQPNEVVAADVQDTVVNPSRHF